MVLFEKKRSIAEWISKMLEDQSVSHHTTGLNFFSATTIPRYGGLQFWCLKHFFSFSPSKADATTFKAGFIMTLSLCQTGHVFKYSVLLSFCGLSKIIGQRKLAWKPTIGAFHAFSSKPSTTIASLSRIWTNSSRQVVLNCCCQGHLLFSFYLEFGVSCDCNIVPIF